jgi:hypothetical protein
MKMIEKGEPIADIVNKDWGFLFQNGSMLNLEDGVTYLFELTPVLADDETEIRFNLKVIGKKHEYMCGDCGVNFISHKGMCSSCYVKQL